MSVAVALHLRGQKVLIVGGGKVALRKAEQFIQEQAEVTVLAFTFVAGFDALALRLIKGHYAPEWLQGQFLVYAASDDAGLNARVIRDARALGILCGSATQDAAALFTSLRQHEEETYMLALSTHGHAIALGKEMMDACCLHIQERFGRRLALLADIHALLGERFVPLRPFLAQQEEEKLAVFIAMLRNGKATVYVFHGSDEERAITQLRKVFWSVDGEARCFCFASRRVNARCPHVLSLDELAYFARAMRDLITFHFQLAFVQQRQLYDAALAQLDGLGKIASFWMDAAACEMLAHDAARAADGARVLFITHHPFARLKKIADRHGMMCIALRDELPDIQGRVLLIAVFMSYGAHVRKDLFEGASSIAAKLRAKGCMVDCDICSLCERPWVIQRLLRIETD